MRELLFGPPGIDKTKIALRASMPRILRKIRFPLFLWKPIAMATKRVYISKMTLAEPKDFQGNPTSTVCKCIVCESKRHPEISFSSVENTLTLTKIKNLSLSDKGYIITLESGEQYLLDELDPPREAQNGI